MVNLTTTKFGIRKPETCSLYRMCKMHFYIHVLGYIFLFSFSVPIAPALLLSFPSSFSLFLSRFPAPFLSSQIQQYGSEGVRSSPQVDNRRSWGRILWYFEPCPVPMYNCVNQREGKLCAWYILLTWFNFWLFYNSIFDQHCLHKCLRLIC